ncbi:MAG: lysylphosphatidylglycerol synthase transmembrane domain-containing protein [Nitrososphaeria archaeon]
MKYKTLRIAFTAVVVVAMAVLIAYLFKETDVVSIIERTDPELLLGGAGLEVFGLFLYALSWHVLLISGGIKVKLRKSLVITWSSLFLLYVTPAGILMDVSRAILMGKEGKNTSASTASVIMQRVLYAFAYVIVTTASIFVIYFYDRPRFHLIYPFIFIVVLAAAAGAFILAASRHRGLVGWTANHLFNFYYKFIKKVSVDKRAKEKAQKTTIQFSDAIVSMSHSPMGALLSLTIIVARLLVAALVSYWVFISLNYYGISFWEITLVMLVGELVTSIPVGVPGMLGFVEAAMSLSYVALGVPAGIAIAATLLIRLILYWWDVVITGIIAALYSGGLKTFLRASEQES